MTWGLSLLRKYWIFVLPLMQLRIRAALFIVMYSSYCSMSFTAFRRVDMDCLRKLVLRAPTKSCLLDPVPTNIMKDCLDELLPILSTMINLSLESGFFRDIWKDAVVTPLLKRNKHFRPISNLSLVSKLAERVAADQIQSKLMNMIFFLHCNQPIDSTTVQKLPCSKPRMTF